MSFRSERRRPDRAATMGQSARSPRRRSAKAKLNLPAESLDCRSKQSKSAVIGATRMKASALLISLGLYTIFADTMVTSLVKCFDPVSARIASAIRLW